MVKYFAEPEAAERVRSGPPDVIPDPVQAGRASLSLRS
jgi:hypothetical protein